MRQRAFVCMSLLCACIFRYSSRKCHLKWALYCFLSGTPEFTLPARGENSSARNSSMVLFVPRVPFITTIVNGPFAEGVEINLTETGDSWDVISYNQGLIETQWAQEAQTLICNVMCWGVYLEWNVSTVQNPSQDRETQNKIGYGYSLTCPAVDIDSHKEKVFDN